MTADGQIKSFFERWENLEAEKKQVADLMKDLFTEAKGFGYQPKALRAAFRLKAKQDLDSPVDAEFEAIVDVYVSALNAPAVQARDARMRARENIEEFDPITGEFIEESQANVEEEAADESAVVSDDPASRTDDVRERQHASTVGFAGDCRTGGKEQVAAAPVPEGEAGAYAEGLPANSKTDAAISRPGIATLGRPEIENRSDEEAPEADASGGVQDECAIHPATHSEKATVATQGEATAPTSDQRVSLDEGSSAAANVGGDHVTAQPAAKHQAEALVKSASATKPLRPLCRNPGEHCGGYGSTHCGSCLRASKEQEVAA